MPADPLRWLDFDSASELPESHAWPDLHDCPAGNAQETVPVIDLASADALSDIGRACEDWGVFQIIGHGVPGRVLDAAEAQARRLFSLPAHHKLRAARPSDGFAGYGVARISRFFSKLMWSEGFTIVGSPETHARLLWPTNYAPFCDVIEEYEEEMRRVAGRTMRMMMMAIDLTENDARWVEMMERFPGVLQLNSYPPCPDPDRAMGLAPHTDSTFLTIIHQTNVCGLQVMRPTTSPGPVQWVMVPPLPGALVVNVGDLGHIISNGRFHNVMHRAIVNRSTHRLSLAYLCGPPGQEKVSPMIGPGEGAMYREVTWAEYLALKGKYFTHALASIRVPTLEESSSRNDNTHDKINSKPEGIICQA